MGIEYELYECEAPNRSELRGIHLNGIKMPVMRQHDTSFRDALTLFREACRQDPHSLQHTFKVTKEETDHYRSLKTVTEEAPRFLTQEESVEALLEIRKNLQAVYPQPKAFRSLIVTSTGIIRKRDSNFYKIIPLCRELCDPPLHIPWAGIPANYDAIEGLVFEDNRENYNKNIPYLLAFNNNLKLCNQWIKLVFENYQNYRNPYHPYLDNYPTLGERITPLMLNTFEGTVHCWSYDLGIGEKAIRIKQK